MKATSPVIRPLRSVAAPAHTTADHDDRAVAEPVAEVAAGELGEHVAGEQEAADEAAERERVVGAAMNSASSPGSCM